MAIPDCSGSMDSLDLGAAFVHAWQVSSIVSFSFDCCFKSTFTLFCSFLTLQYVLGTSLENSPQTNPVIARIDRKAGHGAGRPTQKLIDEAADCYSFMAKVLGVSWQ
ncbi:hypothetical protein ACLOJK_018191, partial [Asimina triloba]